MSDTLDQVRAHYGADDLTDRIRAALAALGPEIPGRIARVEGVDDDVDRPDDRTQRVEVEDVEIAPARTFRGSAAAREPCDLVPMGDRPGVYPRAAVPARSYDANFHVALPSSKTRVMNPRPLHSCRPAHWATLIRPERDYVV
ncbi:MAG TPA: hypothetical protein VGG92_01880 [Caulobacteraceae bacterium]|jgi:hypothetical protein